MIASLFSVQYVIIALLINIILFIITDTYKSILTIGKGQDPKRGLPVVVIRNILMILVFIVAFALTWILVHYGQIALIGTSIFMTSSWCAILSTLTYNIGIKEIMKLLKNKYQSMIGGQNNHTERTRHTEKRRNKNHRHNEIDYYD